MVRIRRRRAFHLVHPARALEDAVLYDYLFTVNNYGKLIPQQKTGLLNQPGLWFYSFFMPSMKCGRARKANSIAWLRSPLISLLNQSTSMPKAI